ncbi:hypothetical protein L249_3778 [Ophiocordyceps polyrhachis-furcata BCC 54312]|uniref:Uncharacterized protein n=1 Tax=Ophiocordyceps polyrhachis-furcata BCC 54312 TaxID=1330021 RepID=A0A367KZ28_9HYPO|nr:hypothetical protein L249_3778 [Ophiocordyceps polyrhachis-furcata BCC 54312]
MKPLGQGRKTHQPVPPEKDAPASTTVASSAMQSIGLCPEVNAHFEATPRRASLRYHITFIDNDSIISIIYV